jgi:hypothetical protein
VNREVRKLIREMSSANPLWGAPRIHGELLKLGFEINQVTVAKYMVRRRGYTFSHLARLSAPSRRRHRCDRYVRCGIRVVWRLYVMIILAHDSRRIIHTAVTEHPPQLGSPAR